jgi:hypothetical protein
MHTILLLKDITRRTAANHNLYKVTLAMLPVFSKTRSSPMLAPWHSFKVTLSPLSTLNRYHLNLGSKL